MSFKLEYLSAGTNHPDAFIISVNPLIFFYPPSVSLLEPLTNALFPQTIVMVSRSPPCVLIFPTFRDEKKGITA